MLPPAARVFASGLARATRRHRGGARRVANCPATVASRHCPDLSPTLLVRKVADRNRRSAPLNRSISPPEVGRRVHAAPTLTASRRRGLGPELCDDALHDTLITRPGAVPRRAWPRIRRDQRGRDADGPKLVFTHRWWRRPHRCTGFLMNEASHLLAR